MRAEDFNEALTEYEKALTDFEVIHDRIIQHLRDRTMSTLGELQEMEQARRRLADAHRSISSKVTGR